LGFDGISVSSQDVRLQPRNIIFIGYLIPLTIFKLIDDTAFRIIILVGDELPEGLVCRARNSEGVWGITIPVKL